LFFALFLPPFVTAGAGEASVQAQLLILGILVPLTAIPSDIVMALLGRTVTKPINENTRARLIMAWISGLLLMAITLNLRLQFIKFLRSDPRGMRLASLLACCADARCLCSSGAMRFDNFVHNAHTNS